ncbi:hypothetical protein [Kitasatospora phosalacinea]|uniref:hypothetical protein n=1 Tax=Kitasatospora phosalacinea TaxID=2065 RepID=UPI000525CEAC|nr:hypothetical protein [Kitasatospora phosalacinea]
MTTTPTGYRITLAINRPDGAGGSGDHRAVLAALALGDRWGHGYSPPPRDHGTARELVWSEVDGGGRDIESPERPEHE